jgi:hypothetical protein
MLTYRKRYGRPMRPQLAMGDLASSIGTAIDVASDPYLPEVLCHVQQLKQIDHGEAVAVCADTPDGVIGGVGLRNAIGPLRAYVYAQQNKWVYPLAVLAVLGIPLWVGFELGRSAK